MDALYAMLQTATSAIVDLLLHFHINILHRLVDIIPIIVKRLCLLGILLLNTVWAVYKYFTPLPKVRSNQ